jgi:hypothetical protein
MHSIAFKGSGRRVSPPPLHVPKTGMRRVLLPIILALCIAVGILCVYSIKILFFSNGAYAQTGMRNMNTRPGTERFIQELNAIGLDPVPLGKITRTPFSVSGINIGLHGDNIQVFEYPNQDIALKEASLFVKQYDGSARFQWNNSIHLYVKGALAIFYMGSRTEILDALSESSGLSLAEPKRLVTDSGR